ncbi:hypothetical protein PHLCEN_2v10029, partial [Hermanssonia centrifuga]
MSATPRSSAFPRRVRTEDTWTAHRQRLGYPNEFDQWIATKLEEAETALSERCLTKDDARCFLRVEYMKGACEGPFEDSGTFTLYVIAHVSPELIFPKSSRCSPRAIMARFVGWGSEMEAPEWTQWPTNVDREIRMVGGGVAAHMYYTLALTRDNLLEAPHKRRESASIKLPPLVSQGRHASKDDPADGVSTF